MTTGEPRWTIAELGERLSAALAEVDYERPANGQVRAVPDLRTIRYYTTLGLLDRPSAMRGRTALYGPRHLLQLVAVKRSLSDVQAALTGLDDAGLAAIAKVSARVGSGSGSGSGSGPGSAEVVAVAAREVTGPARAAAPTRQEPRFWAAAPAPSVARAAAVPLDPRPAAPTRATVTFTTMAKIDLAPGVSLVIEAAGPGGAHLPGGASIDPGELARAAAPLLDALRRHGLTGDAHEQEETEE